MRATKRLVKAIAALGASAVLCVGTCVAWFVMSNPLDMSGANMSANIGDITKFDVKAYALSVDANESRLQKKTVYKVGDEYDEIKMKTYGDISGGVTALLLKFDCEFKRTPAATYQAYAHCSPEVQQVVTGTGVDEDGNPYDFDCSLSDAVCFYAVADPTDITQTVTDSLITLGDASGFFETAAGAVSKRNVVLNNTITDTCVFYVVIDYNTAYINGLYSVALNLGGSLNSTMKFNNDIDFVIQEN